MLVLAIDTALAACSAAALDAPTDAVLAVRSLPMERGHAEALVPMIAEVAREAGGLSRFDRLVVTTGPGSFTGIRVGVAAARALALATGMPAVGVTTLAALAAPLLDEDDRAPVAAAIDARHGRVFFQLFGPGARDLVPARLLPVREAARSAGTGRVRLVGSGAGLVIEAAGEPRFERDMRDLPDPVWVARLGAAAQAPVRPPRPLYLRPPDAKPQEGARVARR